MKIHSSLYILVILSLFMTSCSNGDDPTSAANERGTLTLHFDNVVGDQDLTLNTGSYTNASGEAFTVTTLRYFISNIVLKSTTGETYAIPKDSSYFLVDEAEDESQDIALKNIPAGDYNQVTFVLGVDSLKSTSSVGERTGVLDPTASDMYWSWNSGYIFFKLEGTSQAVPNGGMGSDKMFYYHVGGYGGYSASNKTINNLKTITLTFNADKAEVRSNIAPEAHFYVDILTLFDGVTKTSIAEHPMVMFSDYSVTLANNYANMISYGHVHNDPKKN